MKSDCNSLQHADLDQSFHEIYVEFIKNEKQMEELTAQVKTLNMERQNIECKFSKTTIHMNCYTKCSNYI